MNILKDKAVKSGIMFSCILQGAVFLLPLLFGFLAFKATGSHSAPSWVQLLVYLVCTFGCIPLKKFFSSKVTDDRLFVCTYAIIYLALSILCGAIMLALIINSGSFLLEMTVSTGLMGGLGAVGFVIFYDFEVCLLPFITGIHDLAKNQERLGVQFCVISLAAQCAGNIIFLNMVLFSRTW